MPFFMVQLLPRISQGEGIFLGSEKFRISRGIDRQEGGAIMMQKVGNMRK